MILSRSDLLISLEAVRGAVADKPIVPILTHVLFAKKYVLAFDSEIGIRHDLPTEFPAEFNIRHETFLKLVKALSAEDVELVLEGKKIQVRCGSHKSTLTQIEEKYPEPHFSGDVEAWRDVPAGFKEGLERALMAVSGDAANRALSAVYIKDDFIYGADGKKGVRCKVPGLGAPEMLLGPKAVKEVIKQGNPKRMAVKGSHVLFDYVNLTLLAALRESAPFPAVMFDKLMSNRKAQHPIPDGFKEAMGRLRLFSKGMDVPKVWLNNTGLMFELTAEDNQDVASETLGKFPAEFEQKGVNPHLLLDMMDYAEMIDFGDVKNVPLYLNGETANFEAIIAPNI